MPDEQIQHFLARVRHEMRGMTEQRRAEELRELEQHLAMLVEGYRAEGLDERRAATAAIQRFGRAEQIGRGLRTADRRRRDQPSVLGYLGFYVVYAAAIVVINLLILAAIDAPLDLPQRFGDRLTQTGIPALLLPPLWIVADLVRHRRRGAKTPSS